MQKVIEDVKRLLEAADSTIKVIDATDFTASDQKGVSSLPETPCSKEEPVIDVQAQSHPVSSKLPTID
jgi:ribosome biogenesis GTPase A